MATIEGFRAYARLDEEDPVAQACFRAAIAYGEAAGVAERRDNELYDLYVYAAALHFFDNRGFSPGYQTHAASQNALVDAWLTKLKMQLELNGRTGGDGDGSP